MEELTYSGSILDDQRRTVFHQSKPSGQRLWRVPILIYVYYPVNAQRPLLDHEHTYTMVRRQPNAEYACSM
jgi:hypothetical protein